MRVVPIGRAQVSGLCIGGNPFSGFSHQNGDRDRQMRAFYTPERIKDTLRAAEAAGINTFFGRTDDHIHGIIREYRAEGGTIQWFAQVCTDRDQPDSWRKWLHAAIDLGACAAYIHGGVVDSWHANEQFDTFEEALAIMRQGGIAAGFAGHQPAAHAWIRDNLDVDFQMCCHYNPSDRSKRPQHTNVGEKWDDEDREIMLRTVATIPKPVVHYKVFAGGNRPIVPAFEVLGRTMRPGDVACVGFFLDDDPDMIRQDIELFEKHVDGGQSVSREGLRQTSRESALA